jgi:1-acyl-sn-glycerol-3-phosphate acyltransferase
MKSKSQKYPVAAVPKVSARFINFFAAYSRWYLGGHFHSIRILKSGLPPRDLSRPLVIYLNHASWWDPLVCLQLSKSYFRSRTAFAPIDAAALRRYGFFNWLGFYPVEPRSTRGARSFLKTSRAILASEHNMIWLTPQGRFSDVRERPVRLQRGIGVLASQIKEAVFVPLVIEYAFWTEPRPEVLLSFGEATTPKDELTRSAREWTEFFGDSLGATQDKLAAGSCRRDPAEWIVLDRGASGVTAMYDAWRRLRSWITGVEYIREHQPENAQWSFGPPQ